MRRLLVPLLALMLAGVIAACAPQATATPYVSPAPLPTPTPSPTAAPTAPPTPAPTAAPFAGQPYALDLPADWVVFDVHDTAGKDALAAFVAANPNMAGPIAAFQALENVTIAVDAARGSVLAAYPFLTQGQSLEALTSNFTTQFGNVEGVVEPPVAESIDLPAGPASHWNLTIEANDPGGGTYQVGESIYLATSGETGVLAVFVQVAGTGITQEASIIQTLRFT